MFLNSFSLEAQQETSTEALIRFERYRETKALQQKAIAGTIAGQKGWTLKKALPGGGVMELMALERNGMPVYYITDNVIAAITSGTDKLWQGGSSGLGLNGEGFIIGIWDAGRVRQLHQEFNDESGSRVTLGDGLIPLEDHSTHVAGTLIAEGQMAAAKGMAPAALLHSFDWNEDISEMAEEYNTNGIAVSNHSYGYIHGWYQDDEDAWWWYGDLSVSETEDYHFGFYDEITETWDSLAYLCPGYLIVKSAGNDRGTSHAGDHWVFYNGDWVPSNATRDPDGGNDGYDCIGDIGSAKNILTVGAVNDIPGGYSGPDDVSLATFSSWGPTDDGRIKPDIVANGVFLYSSLSANNSAYGYSSGTSMASPTTCGTLALLQDYYDSLNGSFLAASALKALVINTAFECGNNAGPEYSYGWGLLNSAGAASMITKEFTDGDVINVNFLFNTEIETYDYYSFGDTAINVTICWTDPPGTADTPSLNPAGAKLIHDLDLRIISESGTIYFPWLLDPSNPAQQAGTGDNTRDNIEKITIASPPAGDYTIQVGHKGTISGQQYAMVVSGMSSLHPTNTWTGTAGTGWNNAANWSLGHAPTAPEHIIIPGGCTYYPVLTGNLAVGYYTGYTYMCQSLVIQEGAILTISGKDLIATGPVSVSGILFIGDDAFMNDGAILTLTSAGTIYTGYTDGYHGNLMMEPGSSILQSGGNLYSEEVVISPGSQYLATAGYFHLYKHGTANSTQNITIKDPDNQFYNFNVDTLAQAQLSNCTELLKVIYSTKITGKLAVDEFDLQTYFMNVYGELEIPAGTINVTQTGPVFYYGSSLVMTGGELISNNSIWFNSGSGVDISGGTISIRRDLYNNAGEFNANGGMVRFFGNLPSEIKGSTTFYGLKIDKNQGVNVLSSSGNVVSDTLIINSGNLVVRNSTLHAGSGN